MADTDVLSPKRRSKVCLRCEQPFVYEMGMGKDRLYCSSSCAWTYQNARRKERYPGCSAEGCTSKVRSGGSIYCEMHYGRMRRKGTLEARGRKQRVAHSNGYVLFTEPGHPLADSSGYVYEHRKVLFDKLNGISAQCHWCGVELTWATTECDHLDADKANNDPKNLVPSCGPCNRRRGVERMRATLLDRSGLTFRGVTLPKKEWASRLGLTESAIQLRLDAGWTVEEALTLPKRARR